MSAIILDTGDARVNRTEGSLPSGEAGQGGGVAFHGCDDSPNKEKDKDTQ